MYNTHMFKSFIKLILLSPQFKNLINDVRVIPQIIEQMNKAMEHIRTIFLLAVHKDY